MNIKIGPGGDLFVVDFTGSLRRISYPGGQPGADRGRQSRTAAGPLPLMVNFDGTGSTDPDAGDALSYAWDLDGDGQFDDSTAVKPSRTYTQAANVTVRLRVTDKGGLSATARLTIGAGNEPPNAEIDSADRGAEMGGRGHDLLRRHGAPTRRTGRCPRQTDLVPGPCATASPKTTAIRTRSSHSRGSPRGRSSRRTTSTRLTSNCA